MIACIAMTAAVQAGLKVPKQVQVIGFDDSSISRLCTPKLSTISMDRKRIAKTAIDMLVQMMEGRQPDHVDFETTLIQRDSTKS